MEIAILGGRAVAANLEILDHPAAQRCHGVLLLWRVVGNAWGSAQAKPEGKVWGRRVVGRGAIRGILLTGKALPQDEYSYREAV
jgi:hypothetical protein